MYPRPACHHLTHSQGGPGAHRQLYLRQLEEEKKERAEEKESRKEPELC